MVREDMRAVKDFLWERNNAGQLNIDKLCIVGADMGASVALDVVSVTSVAFVQKKRAWRRRPEEISEILGQCSKNATYCQVSHDLCPERP